MERECAKGTANERSLRNVTCLRNAENYYRVVCKVPRPGRAPCWNPSPCMVMATRRGRRRLPLAPTRYLPTACKECGQLRAPCVAGCPGCHPSGPLRGISFPVPLATLADCYLSHSRLLLSSETLTHWLSGELSAGARRLPWAGWAKEQRATPPSCRAGGMGGLPLSPPGPWGPYFPTRLGSQVFPNFFGKSPRWACAGCHSGLPRLPSPSSGVWVPG